MCKTMCIPGQISLYDITTENVPVGTYVDEPHMGGAIPFTKLESYIGKKVVVSANMRTGRTVVITDYYKNSDQFYSLEKDGAVSYQNDFYYGICGDETRKLLKPAFKCDRIGYTDQARNRKANSWVSEAYCTNGRFDPVFSCPECFFEYKAI